MRAKTSAQIEEEAQRRADEAAAVERVANYRTTRTPAVTTLKPTPAMYGMWDDFDFEEFDREERQFRSARSIAVGVAYFILGAIVTTIGSFILGRGFGAQSLQTSLWCYAFIGTPCLVMLYRKLQIEQFLRKCLTNYLVYSDNVSAYRATLAGWEFTNAERGLGYWQGLRGVEFEAAVALLLKRRSCNVTTTKGSGDGGVDLVVTIGGNALWCQCKGHAKAVSVAPIREIAGVCSRGQARAVIIAANGYTRPAVEAASDLGVAHLDARDLCNLARLEEIRSIEHFLHPLRALALQGQAPGTIESPKEAPEVRQGA